MTHEDWIREGQKGLMEKALEVYQSIMQQDNLCLLSEDKKRKLDAILNAADSRLVE